MAVFGFVNFGAIDKNFEGSGYLGLQDQVAALKWIKENISEFGGNPENITIFGESAGAISCMMLTVIPAAKCLFGKAIPQSANSYMHNTPEYSTELRNLYITAMNARFDKTVKDYLPTCDGKFLPENPFKALKDGDARGIKILTGTTADEWRYWFFYYENLLVQSAVV